MFISLGNSLQDYTLYAACSMYWFGEVIRYLFSIVS
ncbi:Uncharacterised protein [Escherichia coli]|nr:Uncharacterised protein [Escherichia coli]CTU32077.1 Uncharacterised protein [Escherichia coli]CTV85190.1 Uncharacterised protein [Escherichia coli]CTW08480.1 Uncharacterised protein [Escherichia coli]CTW51537.1 Uncharacterised protein [Escherichia coli]